MAEIEYCPACGAFGPLREHSQNTGHRMPFSAMIPPSDLKVTRTEVPAVFYDAFKDDVMDEALIKFLKSSPEYKEHYE